MSDTFGRIARKLNAVGIGLIRRDLKQRTKILELCEIAKAHVPHRLGYAAAAVGPLAAIGITGRYAWLVRIVFSRERREDIGKDAARHSEPMCIGPHPAMGVRPQPSGLLMAQPRCVALIHATCLD
jgi:hypothetical protein